MLCWSCVLEQKAGFPVTITLALPRLTKSMQAELSGPRTFDHLSPADRNRAIVEFEAEKARLVRHGDKLLTRSRGVPGLCEPLPLSPSQWLDTITNSSGRERKELLKLLDRVVPILPSGPTTSLILSCGTKNDPFGGVVEFAGTNQPTFCKFSSAPETRLHVMHFPSLTSRRPGHRSRPKQRFTRQTMEKKQQQRTTGALAL